MIDADDSINVLEHARSSGNPSDAIVSPVALCSATTGTAPAGVDDSLRQRKLFGTGQTVDCAVDLGASPPHVATVGNERWLGIFLRFERQLSNPRTDGNSQEVFFRRDESLRR